MAVAVAAVSACGDSTEPVQIPLPEESTQAVVFDFITGDILDPSAFDVVTRNVVRTDQVSGWDFVYYEDENLGPVIVTRGSYFQEEDEQAGAIVVPVSFDELTEAPESGYTVQEPVPIATGEVFVIRSRSDDAFGNLRCRRYGKFSVDGIDPELGTMTFSHLINPNCENRNLDPGTNP
jgi:hypothetical protein